MDSTNTKTYKKGLIYNFLGLATRAARPIYLITFSRLLGAEFFGLYILCYSITETISKFAFLGFNQGVLRLVAKLESENKIHEINHNVHFFVGISLLATCILASAFYIFALPLSSLLSKPQLAPFFKTFAFVLPGWSAAYIYLGALRGKLNMKYEYIIQSVVEPLLVLSIGLYLVFHDYQVHGLGIAHMVGAWVSGVLAMITFHKSFSKSKQENQRRTFYIRFVFKESFSMWWIQCIGAFKNNMDVMILGKTLTLREVGIYGAINELGNAVRKIKSVFDPILMPLVQKLYLDKTQPDHFKKTISNTFLWMQMPVFIIAASIFIHPMFFMNFFSISTQDISNIVRLIILSHVLFTFFGVYESTFLMIGKGSSVLAQNIIFIILNIGCLILFSKHYGLTGTSIAIALSQFFLSSIRWVTFKNEFKGIFVPALFYKKAFVIVLIYSIAYAVIQSVTLNLFGEIIFMALTAIFCYFVVEKRFLIFSRK